VDSDQQVVNKELSHSAVRVTVHLKPADHRFGKIVAKVSVDKHDSFEV